jgi:ribosome-associated protein
MSDNEHDDLPPSRTAKRRAAKEIEALAHEVTDLPEAEFARLTVPPALVEEVVRARATKGHGSRKRQTKFLAGVLRRHDEERAALRVELDALQRDHRYDTRAFHEIEALRDRLCDPEQLMATLDELRPLLPAAEVAGLARLARSAHDSNDRRAAREIFKRLRAGLADPNDER